MNTLLARYDALLSKSLRWSRGATTSPLRRSPSHLPLDAAAPRHTPARMRLETRRGRRRRRLGGAARSRAMMGATGGWGRSDVAHLLPSKSHHGSYGSGVARLARGEQQRRQRSTRRSGTSNAKVRSLMLPRVELSSPNLNDDELRVALLWECVVKVQWEEVKVEAVRAHIYSDGEGRRRAMQVK